MPEALCVDPAPLAAILSRYPHCEPSLLPVLQDVQRAYRYLPCSALGEVSRALGVPLARVFSVATFYRAFALTPQGETVVKVCTGTACHIRGAQLLLDELERGLKIAPDQTTSDGKFTLKTVNCVGACAMAPVLAVGERYHGGAQASKVAGSLAKGGEP